MPFLLITICLLFSLHAHADSGAGGDGGTPDSSSGGNVDPYVAGGGGDGGPPINNPSQLPTQTQPPSYNPYGQPLLDAEKKTAPKTQDQTSEIKLSTDTTKTAKVEPVAVQVVRLDQQADDSFHGGVATVAFGIMQLSEAEASKSETGNTPEVQKARAEALQTIGEGNTKISDAIRVNAHANAIRANENKLASMNTSGASMPYPMHTLNFDKSKLSNHAQEMVEGLEQSVGVRIDHLAAAAKAGNFNEVSEIVASATNVTMSAHEIAAAMPDFGASTAMPTAPVLSAGNSYQPMRALASEKVVENFAPRAETKKPGLEENGKSNFNESLTPFEHSQLFNAPLSKDELGDPDKDLFQRVRSQYKQRLKNLSK